MFVYVLNTKGAIEIRLFINLINIDKSCGSNEINAKFVAFGFDLLSSCNVSYIIHCDEKVFN